MGCIHSTIVMKEVLSCDVRKCYSRVGGMGMSEVTAVRFCGEDVEIEVHLTEELLKHLSKALGVKTGQEEVADLLKQLESLRKEQKRLEAYLQSWADQ